MNNNLIPPFILREAGLKVNDVPKIHVQSQTVSDHAIEFLEQEDGASLRIPSHLWGIFSFFHTCAPTNKEATELEPLFPTPDSDHWNPHSGHFANNEESMLDWEQSKMQTKRRRINHVLDLNTTLLDFLDVDDYMDRVTLSAFNASHEEEDQSMFVSDEFNEFVNALFNNHAEIFKISMSIGSTSAHDEFACDLFKPTLLHMDEMRAEIDALQASQPSKVSPDFLSMIMNIKLDLARKVANQNTQLYRVGDDNEYWQNLVSKERIR